MPRATSTKRTAGKRPSKRRAATSKRLAPAKRASTTKRPEKVGEQAVLYTAAHPKRSNSPTYNATRKWLMASAGGGCIICGGESDLTHPGAPASPRGLQDHHGGGIYVVLDGVPVLVGINLFPMEWSEGWGADPAVVTQRTTALNVLLGKLGQPTYDAPITDARTVMNYVDSPFNANIKMCAAHHIALEEKDAKDASGHQAVGIHSIPFPIWAYQGFCDWDHWDMWGGTTGTIALGGRDPKTGEAQVLHVSRVARARSAKNRGENDRLVRAWHTGRRDIRLPPDHNLVLAAEKGG